MPEELTLEADADLQSVKFHDNLEILTLNGPPFSIFKAAITRLTTLTWLALTETDSKDSPTPNDLLRILKNNPKLEYVSVFIANKPIPGVEPDLEPRIELQDLNRLIISTNTWEYARYMISHIGIPANESKKMKVKICCFPGPIPLKDALQSIKGFPIASSPIHMEMNLSGESSVVMLYNHSKSKKLTLWYVTSNVLCAVLKEGHPLLSCKNIKSLVLWPENRTPSLSSNVLLFPALKTITIAGWDKIDQNQRELLENFARSLGFIPQGLDPSAEKVAWQK